ncbi:MAG TPA: tetratricopeptide repeat protein, partial [Gemmatimonadaceae bacterium]|nr:tetratricopeptide repeat protein [Gemmatimonadaceae bacterium]
MTRTRRFISIVALLAGTPVVGACAQSPGARTAEVVLAEQEYRHGDRPNAVRRALAITRDYESGGTRWSSADRAAAGRAYLLLSAGNAAAVRQALAAFDAAAAADSTNMDARLRAAELLLDKYNFPDAKASFEDVLQRSPGNARALLGLAHIAAQGSDSRATTLLRQSLVADPTLVDAQLMLARTHLEAESYDSASIAARRAIASDSSSIAAWALLGATAWLSGDSAEYSRALAAARRINPRPSDFFAELAEAAARQRRYADGVRLAREALALDSSSTRALGLVGSNELRAGNMEEGRARLERAFAIDPFNLWHKNTLDLLDRLRTFRTIERGRFRFVAPPEEAELLVTYLSPLLEEAFDSLAARYHYRPPTPVRLELYRRHADFSVRTVGLTGLGALGVSFGSVLAMDAPSARERGDFNWGSTAWHELTHAFTLGLSESRAPRWLSEGLSVLEERRARPGWGAGASMEFLAAYSAGRIRPPSQLNDGFVRPRYPSETILSYYDASLVCEMIESQFGASALVEMLRGYRDGLSTPQVFARVLKTTPEQLDTRFDAWLRARFATPLHAVPAGTGDAGPFVDAMRSGIALLDAGKSDSARTTLLRAQAMFPEYAGPNAPAEYLARIARERGELRAALDQITRVTSRSERAWDANLLEADLREALGDSAGAMIPLERLIWISPYDAAMHVRLADLATLAGRHAIAIRERRAVLALDPSDPLEARYQLARALAASGDVAGA